MNHVINFLNEMMETGCPVNYVVLVNNNTVCWKNGMRVEKVEVANESITVFSGYLKPEDCGLVIDRNAKVLINTDEEEFEISDDAKTLILWADI